MTNKEKVKDIYKSIVRIFLNTNEEATYWESQRIMSKLPSLFPEINFNELRNKVRDELFNHNTHSDKEILGYRYGNSPEIHDSLPDYDEEIVIVYKNGTTEGYDYFGGKLTRTRC